MIFKRKNVRYCPGLYQCFCKTLSADKNHHDFQSFFVYPLFWIIFSKKVCFQVADKKVRKKNKKTEEDDHITHMHVICNSHFTVEGRLFSTLARFSAKLTFLTH